MLVSCIPRLRRVLANVDFSRPVDSARPSLCDSQVVHLHSSPVNSCGHAEGGQDLERMGLEYWKDAETRKLSSESRCGFERGREHKGDWGEA